MITVITPLHTPVMAVICNDFIGFYCRFVDCEGSADESNGEKVGKNFVFHEKVVPLHR